MVNEYYKVEYWSHYCVGKSIIGSTNFNTIEEANKEYNRVTRLGYAAEIAKITILKQHPVPAREPQWSDIAAGNKTN